MPSPVVHFEIGCRDSARTKAFFAGLFGWSIDAHNQIGAAAPGGIGGHITSLGHEPHNYVTFYAEVDDVQNSIDLAVSLGGKKVVGPVPIPGRGTFAWIADPDGNVVGLWKTQKA